MSKAGISVYINPVSGIRSRGTQRAAVCKGGLNVDHGPAGAGNQYRQLSKTPSGTLNHTAGSTMAFMVLAMSQLVQALNMRSSHSLFKIGFFSNKTMNLSLLACTGLTAFVLFVPGVVNVFGMMMLDWWMYLIGLGLSLLPILVMEIAKAIGFIKVHVRKG